jgi:ATP-dependent DNA helicase RecG
VEVGVNVPNATVIAIEGSDRFGLSQLHQLRGRVIRGNHQAYCYLCTQTTNAKSVERLQALKNAKNGFDLAELDLKMRGAGDLYGDKQWGLSDIGMEAIKNLRMVEAARTEATRVVEQGLLDEYMTRRLKESEILHME